MTVRRILHHNVTRNPNALWVTLQLHETWDHGQQPQRFLIFDRDSKFSADVVSTVKAMGRQPIRTAFRSPWQNGIAERWVGSVRRDLLNHVIVLNRKHLRRLLNEYVRYYHEDRTHLGLGKDTPGSRVAASAPLAGPQSYLLAATRWAASPLHSRGLMTLNFQLELGSFAVRMRAIHAWISVVDPVRSFHATQCSKATPCKEPPSKEEASCIESSAARLVLMNHNWPSSRWRYGYREFGDRMDRSPKIQWLMKELAGYNLNAASDVLATLSEFEEEKRDN